MSLDSLGQYQAAWENITFLYNFQHKILLKVILTFVLSLTLLRICIFKYHNFF